MSNNTCPQIHATGTVTFRDGRPGNVSCYRDGDAYRWYLAVGYGLRPIVDAVYGDSRQRADFSLTCASSSFEAALAEFSALVRCTHATLKLVVVFDEGSGELTVIGGDAW